MSYTGSSFLSAFSTQTGIQFTAVELAVLGASLQYNIDNGTFTSLSATLQIMGLSGNAKEQAIDSGDVTSFVTNTMTSATAVETELTNDSPTDTLSLSIKDGATSVTEGESVEFLISGGNSGESVSYTLSGTDIELSDLRTPDSLSSSVTLDSNGEGSILLTPEIDETYDSAGELYAEDTETLIISLVGLSATASINIEDVPVLVGF